MASGPTRPSVKVVEVQADDLPVFTGLVSIVEQEEEDEATRPKTQDTEDPNRWDRRTRQGTRGATVPPSIPDRSVRQKMTTEDITRSELVDPDFFPRVQKDKCRWQTVVRSYVLLWK